jgi:hypothetical protein
LWCSPERGIYTVGEDAEPIEEERSMEIMGRSIFEQAVTSRLVQGESMRMELEQRTGSGYQNNRPW